MVSEATRFTLLAIPWILFFVVWTVSIFYEAARGRLKKVEKREPMPVLLFTRLLLYIPIVLIFANEAIATHFPFGLRILPDSPFAMYFGVAVSMAGILFSIWGRVALGSNWSADAVLKSDQTLVSKGPYSFVRNPIYSGISLGMVGSAISLGNLSGLIAVALILTFSYLRITYEERMMNEKFGAEWERYTERVKRFIPWIW